MELPESFCQDNELVKVVRKFIMPNFLLNKREALKCYCRLLNCNNHNHSNSIERYFQVERTYFDSYQNKHYDINLCTVNGRKLTKVDMLSLFENAKKDTILCFKKLLQELIHPQKLRMDLIEIEVGRKIYPLDKTQLFEFVSYNFFKQFYHCLLMNTNFIQIKKYEKVVNKKYITIQNDKNDVKIAIPCNTFVAYCGINTLIENSGEKIDSIVSPFTFNRKAASYFLNCLINGYFIHHSVNRFTASDFNELKQLFSYLQVTFK